MTPRPFRFGLQLWSAPSRAEWAAVARRAETLGYDVVCVPDHVGAQLSPFAALQAMADATERIKVGTFVLDNDFRHPLLTAHEAATVHLLSDGRLELGLGAGWLRRDYERLGIEFASPRTRVERLEEAVAIVTRYFDGEPFSFEGAHYSVHDVEPLKLPPHLGAPKLTIGGGGPRILKLMAAHADVASVFLTAKPEGSEFEPMTTAVYRDKVERLRRDTAAASRDVEVNVLLQAFEITDGRNAAVKRWANEFETTVEDFLALPFGLVGTLDEIGDDLIGRRDEFGVSYVTVRLEQLETFAPVVERLAGT